MNWTQIIPIGYMVVILIMTIIVARVANYFMNKRILESIAWMNIEHMQHTFIKHFVLAIIYIVGIGLALYMLPGFHNLSVSILAGSGVFAVVLGFASQHALSNMVSGIFIILFKPFRVGDRIKLPGKNVWGVVEDITLRHTIIRTYENKRLVVPNSIISTEIIENSDLGEEKICRFIEIGISYDADIDKAMNIIEQESLNHKDTIDNRTPEEKIKGEPQVPVRLVSFGESSVNLRGWVWFKDWPTGYVAICDINKNIKQRFDKEGIEIPFPHRTVVYKEKGKVL